MSVIDIAKRWVRLLDAKMARRTGRLKFEHLAFEVVKSRFWDESSQWWFDDEIAPYFLNLTPGKAYDTVLDAGASSGLFSIAFARRYPSAQIFAFEPSARQRIIFNKNIALNDLGGRIQIVPTGLWNREDRLKFKSVGAMSSIQGVGMLDTGLNFGETIRVCRLDDWWQNAGMPAVSLIKMDIEGAEIEALQGGKNLLTACRPDILLQAYHIREGKRTFEECVDFLQRLNYDVPEVKPGSGFAMAQFRFDL